jgi:hypothetical protein
MRRGKLSSASVNPYHVKWLNNVCQSITSILACRSPTTRSLSALFQAKGSVGLHVPYLITLVLLITSKTKKAIIKADELIKLHKFIEIVLDCVFQPVLASVDFRKRKGTVM